MGVVTGLLAACGSSGSHTGEPGPASGGHSAGGSSSGASGEAGEGANGGSANGARGGSGAAGSGGSSATGGTHTTGSGGSSATGGTRAAGGTHASGGTGGTAEEGGGENGARSGSAGTAGSDVGSGGGAGASGGSSGDAGAPGGTNGDGSGGAAPVPTSVTLSVHTGQDAHPISPLIYGINPVAIDCTNSAARFTLCRLGGNRWSTYNWETNASNSGGTCDLNDGSLGGGDTAGAAVTDVVTAANGVGATTLVTLPILDHVAADELGGTSSPTCTGDVRDTADYLDTRFIANTAAKGAAFVYPPDTSDGLVYSDEFVSYLENNTNGAPILFGLDDEPAIWNDTQPAAHPDQPTYAEVVARNLGFARSTRDAWPSAEISGYVGYGYLGFYNLQDAPDANGLFLDYYLNAIDAAATNDGRRLVDYLDVHWYSEMSGAGERIVYNGSAPDEQRARVQAPRSLWDPNFTEDTYITRYYTHAPIRLIPWLKERLAAHDPHDGFAVDKLAISEWSYGGGADVSGAVAAADALGIFGREGVDLAAWKSQTGDDPFVLGAFQIFRNFDGAGAAFGDTSVGAASSDDSIASVYASVDSANTNRVVIVAINRAENALDTTLSVDDPQTFTTADVYALTSASPTPTAATALAVSTSANTFEYEMPAYSVSVIVPKP